MGTEIEVYGKYGVQRLGGHALKVKDTEGNWKRIKRIAFIQLLDDQFIQLESRPDQEMDTLENQYVVACGRLIEPPEPSNKPVMAQPSITPMLVEITSIQLTPDE